MGLMPRHSVSVVLPMVVALAASGAWAMVADWPPSGAASADAGCRATARRASRRTAAQRKPGQVAQQSPRSPTASRRGRPRRPARPKRFHRHSSRWPPWQSCSSLWPRRGPGAHLEDRGHARPHARLHRRRRHGRTA